MEIDESVFETIDDISGDRSNEVGKSIAMARIVADECKSPTCLKEFLLGEMTKEFRRIGAFHWREKPDLLYNNGRNAWIRCQAFSRMLERLLAQEHIEPDL